VRPPSGNSTVISPETSGILRPARWGSAG
jgi:hypothetical protein